MREYIKIITRTDLIIISAILVLGLAMTLTPFLRFSQAEAHEAYLLIQIDEDIVYREPLPLPDQIITIPLPKGEANINVEDGKAWVLPMPLDICPEQICCHQMGKISRPGQMIVCLPNLMVVRIDDSR